MGVKEETINRYTVYSKEVAKEMAFNISKFANSTYGVGITGRLSMDVNSVNICIYDKKSEKYYETYSIIEGTTREEQKLNVIKLLLN